MSESKKTPAILFGLGITPLAAVGSLFLASFILKSWLKLKSSVSLMMLPKYWDYYDRLPEHFRFPLHLTTALTVVLTLAPFVIILAVLFIKPKRELHGSARFASAAEIVQTGLLKQPSNPTPKDKKKSKQQAKQKSDDKPDYPSILLGKYKGKFLRWVGNEFLFVAARTRAGKGVSLIIPNCLHYRDSMVIYDPKFENFLITAGFRASVGQKVFLFNPGGLMPGMSKSFWDNPEEEQQLSDAERAEREQHKAKLQQQSKQMQGGLRSHRWNPYTYISRNPLFMYKDVSNMAAIMLPMSGKSGSGENNSFWVESARKLFVGLSLYMLETEQERKDRDTNIKSRSTLSFLFRLTTPSNGKTLEEWIKAEIAKRNRAGKPLSDACQTLLGGFANGNTKTNADIIATLTAPLGIFLDPKVEAATSGDDFRLDDIRRQRMTIYIGINPTETTTFARLTNLFFSQLINVNVEQGLPENNIDPETGKTSVPHQVLLLMDEFPALGNVPAIMDGVSYVAGYGLRLMIIAQSPAQIESVYGRENARTFFTNFAARILFTPRDQTEAEEYSKILGNETVKAKSISRSTGKGSNRSTSTSDQRRALMYDSEIKQMPMTDCILDMAACRPIYAKKIRYFEDDAFKSRANMGIPTIPKLEIGNQQPNSTPPNPNPATEPPNAETKLTDDEVAFLDMMDDWFFNDLLNQDDIKTNMPKHLYNEWGVADMPTVRKLLAETDDSETLPLDDEAENGITIDDDEAETDDVTSN